MKVLHIIKSLGRGGAEMLLPETLAVHDRSKFEFHCIYFLPWKNQLEESIRQQGGTVTCFAAKNNLQLVLQANKVAEYVKKNGIQLIHAHLPWAGILARIVGRKTGVPVVYTEHNKQERYHFATRWMNLATINWQDRLVAVSADVEASIRKHKRGLRVKLQTVLNGVNTARFSPGAMVDREVLRVLNIPEGTFVIGTIAVFRFQKRLDLWIEVAARILDHVPNAHFLILGDGPLKEPLLAKRKELKLEDRVHFAGLQTEVRPYLAGMDIYMMSSVFEGLPIALLEAMSSGCAVVTTDAGGIKEVIRDGQDGVLCGVDEPYRLAELAIGLTKDDGRRRQLGEQARVRVMDSFSINRMVQELEKIYRELVLPGNEK